MLVLTLALAVSSLLVREDELAVVNAEHGFRIERPDATWRYLAAAEQGDAKYVLNLFPSGSVGLPSVVVYVAKWDGKTTPADLRDIARKKLEDSGATDVETFERELGGRTAECVKVKSSKAGIGEFHLAYAYVDFDSRMFVLQSAWAATEAADASAAVESLLKSFRAFAPEGAVVDPVAENLRKLADRCGSEIPWAASWEDAAKRARDEGKLVFAVHEVYRVITVPRTSMSGVFMDADLVALICERFVPLRIEEGTKAPFRASEVYGMGPASFGTAFYCFDADGRVVAETSVYDIAYLDGFLRATLAERARAGSPGAAKGPGESGATPSNAAEDPLAAATLAYRRGELDVAASLARSGDSPPARRLRAQILRREGHGDDALAELADLPDSDADRAILLMRLGRHAESRAAFLRAAANADDPRASEAEFWLGAYDVLAAGWPRGTERWTRLVESKPDDRFAWKAAANLASIGAFINGVERIEWTDAAVLASVVPSKAAPKAAGDAAKVAAEAVGYLVATQRDDGSWTCPMDAFGFDANLYTPSITALCGMALLPHAHDAKVAAAIRRALDRTLESLRAGRLDAGSGIAGAYTIWSRVFATWFVARAIECGYGGADVTQSLREPLDELVAKVVASQVASGGWPYVLIGDDTAGAGFDPSASFLTAGAVLALLEAKDAGAKVPDGAVDRSLSFLERMRDPDGVYRYMPDIPNTRVDERAPEAAGRGPACALALLRGSKDAKAGTDELARTLEAFVAEQDRFGRAFHKSLCHTEPEGFGAHYLLYDYWLALAAANELPAKEREHVRNDVLTAMLRHRFEDGSFEDLPALGRACATGLALLGLAGS